MGNEPDRISMIGDFFGSIDPSTVDEQFAHDSETTLQYHNRISRNPLLRRSSTLPRVWRSAQYPIYFHPNQQDSVTPRPPEDPSAGSSSYERMSVIADLFSDLEGNLLDLSLDVADQPPPYDSVRPLSRVDTRLSVTSVWSIRDVADVSLPLDVFASLIARHPSLQSVDIVSSEAYKQTHQGITHRFLVLELHRPRKPTIWLRLDRRPQDGVSLFSFVFASGVTAANDSVLVSAGKDTLVDGSVRENRQTFERKITLDDLRHLIVIILDELVVYQLWPANCWFFVSLIQQYLQGHGAGSFVDGSSKWGDTASEVRKRVQERIRLVYHVPRCPSILEVLTSFGEVVTASDLSLVSKNPWGSSNDFPQPVAMVLGLTAAVDIDRIADRLSALGLTGHSVIIRQRLLIIAREVIRRADLAWSRRKPTSNDISAPDLVISQVAPYFQKLARQLEASKAPSDAIMVHREALILYERVANSRPDDAQAQSQLCGALFHLGQALYENSPDDNDVLSLLRRSVAFGNRAQRVRISRHTERRDLVVRLSYLGNVLVDTHVHFQAANVFAQAAALYNGVLFESPPFFSHLMRDLERWGDAMLVTGEYSEMFRDAINAAAAHRVSQMRNDQIVFDRLGALLLRVGDGLYGAQNFDPAVKIYKDLMDYTLVGATDGLAVERSILMKVFEALASALLKLRRFSEAVPPLEAWQRLQLDEIPSESRDRILVTIFTMLGNAFHQQGHFNHSATAFGEATRFARSFPPETIESIHPQRPFLAQCLVSWADALGRCSRWSEAEQALHDCIEILEQPMDTQPRYSRVFGASVMSSMAKVLDRQGRVEESLPFYRESVTLTRRDCDSEAPDFDRRGGASVFALRLANFGSALQRAPSHHKEALSILQEAVKHLRSLVVEVREALAPLQESVNIFKALDANYAGKRYTPSLRTASDCLEGVIELLDGGTYEGVDGLQEKLGGLRI
ncbi:hypothetical protein DL93DRAFT_2163059 [Clavulina sp. PMI_390]|nr:hypothetical protein DL93DRAFT_2163059 [Clavulina sp. PMI_390]